MWSPLGDLIAYARAGETGTNKALECSLVLGHPDGSMLRGVGPCGSATTWSPDGRRLAVTIDPDGRKNIKPLAIIEISTGKIRRVAANTYGDGVDGDAVWAPDGRRLAYGTKHGATTVGIDGTGRRSLRGSNGSSRVIAWGRNGLITILRREEQEIVETTDGTTGTARVTYRAPTQNVILFVDRR